MLQLRIRFMNSFLLPPQVSSEKTTVTRLSTPKLQIARISTVATALTQILYYCTYDKEKNMLMHIHTLFYRTTATFQPPKNPLREQTRVVKQRKLLPVRAKILLSFCNSQKVWGLVG